MGSGGEGRREVRVAGVCRSCIYPSMRSLGGRLLLLARVIFSFFRTSKDEKDCRRFSTCSAAANTRRAASKRAAVSFRHHKQPVWSVGSQHQEIYLVKKVGRSAAMPDGPRATLCLRAGEREGGCSAR